MIGLAFFFLLQPGEYTDSPSETSLFWFVQMWIGKQCLVLCTASAAQVSTATFCSLTFCDQKNTVRGEVIGLGHSGDPHLSPTHILARRILHLRAHNVPNNAPFAHIYQHQHYTAVKPNDITVALRTAITYLTPALLGFLPSDVSAHCLCAAGANSCYVLVWTLMSFAFSADGAQTRCFNTCICKQPPSCMICPKKILSGGTFTLVPNQMVPSF